MAILVATVGTAPIWAVPDEGQPLMGDKKPPKKFVLLDLPPAIMTPLPTLIDEAAIPTVDEQEEEFVPHANGPLDYESPMQIYEGLKSWTPADYPRNTRWGGIRDGY